MAAKTPPPPKFSVDDVADQFWNAVIKRAPQGAISADRSIDPGPEWIGQLLNAFEHFAPNHGKLDPAEADKLRAIQQTLGRVDLNDAVAPEWRDPKTDVADTMGA